MSDVILEAKNILKVYPNGIVANDNVNFELKKDEIHALIGENGAGKSTLMKILFGSITPEEGTITLNGEEVTIDSSKKAIDLGIGMVHQHFMLVDSLTIAENLVLGNEPTKNGIFLDNKKIIDLAEEYNKKYNFNIDINAKVHDVSVGVKQKTEILKALLRGAKILILDEPTAVLTPQETEELFVQLKELKRQGHTIVFISHKLNEIMEICDRVTIMRQGKTVGCSKITDTSVEDISRRMVGRDVILKIEKNKLNRGPEILRAENLIYYNSIGQKKLNDVSLSVRSGEILGVAGVEGNGQAELARVIVGLDDKVSGTMSLNGIELNGANPIERRELGMTYISEDRLDNGVAPDLSILDNIFANRITDFTRHNGFVIDDKLRRLEANALIYDFQILSDSVDQHVGMLSGGNMQKVVGARELLPGSSVVVADQPTRGIDVGAAELMRRKILELRDHGSAIILLSADLNEILELSDSLIVMHNGEISGYFEDTSTLTEEELGYYMLGLKKQDDVERILRNDEKEK